MTQSSSFLPSLTQNGPDGCGYEEGILNMDAFPLRISVSFPPSEDLGETERNSSSCRCLLSIGSPGIILVALVLIKKSCPWSVTKYLRIV